MEERNKMAYRSELKRLFEEKRVLEEKIQESLRPVVFSYVVPVYDIPTTKEEFSKVMKRVENRNKCPWLDLRIIDVLHKNHKNLFIFGEEKFILNHLEKIAEMIKNGEHCKMGHVGVNFGASIKFDMESFL